MGPVVEADGDDLAGDDGREQAAAFERRLTGDRRTGLPRRPVEELDRPAWEPGAAVTGEAALEGCRLLTPVVPGKIVAVGLNYRAHADEVAMQVHAEPILFMKPRTAVIGPGETIVRPARSPPCAAS